MRAVVYTEHGGPEVLRLVERDAPEPGPGELLVQVHVSGVNPTDWKSRRSGAPSSTPSSAEVEQVPNQDGAGVVTAVGPDVDADRIGQRVWLWEAAWQRRGGTAQEYLVLPERQAVPLPEAASLDLGAALGIPALTAHRCLTVAEGGPPRLAPGVLEGRRVLVTGGAGAVGNAAIQLARWAGAEVLSTVSTPEKARLATAAGAQHVVDYRAPDAVDQLRAAAPDGVHLVVDVAVAANLATDLAVLAPGGTVAGYAADAGTEATLGVRELMVRNTRLQFVLVYTVPAAAKERAVSDVAAAVADGALLVGESAGLPLHRFPLERAADAHAAVEAGAIGKVLIDVVDRE
jgi:NADPH2:quinone reductase